LWPLYGDNELYISINGFLTKSLRGMKSSCRRTVDELRLQVK
jgi:hypothetical protein